MEHPAERPSPQPSDDHELIAAIAEGDREALGELVHRHQQRVIELAYRFLHDWNAAEDVCQDTFLRVWRSADRYTPQARVSTWLYRIVANLCWDYRRRSRRTEPLVADVREDPDAESAIRREREDRVRAAVAKLPDRQRLALVLHRFGEMSHAEIAETTGWSIGAVESCIVRAYMQLRSMLADLSPTNRQDPASKAANTAGSPREPRSTPEETS